MLFLSAGSLSCKISNLKCDSVNARDARAVKHETSLSSHMNDVFSKFHDLLATTDKKSS